MAIYLVDYENVKSDGLNGVSLLQPNDQVYIFYSVNADKITFSLHTKLNESKATISYIKVELGHKNALDFQLVTYLGFLLSENKKEQFVIVSNDNGYTPAINFWQKREYNVTLVADLTMADSTKKTKDMFKEVKKLISDESEAQLVTDCIMKYKTKQGINNAIVKVYGTTKGGKLYNTVKPLIHNKKGK